jgi:hypothetical protein
MPWHILIHVALGLLNRKGKAAAPTPPQPRIPRDKEEARRWAENAARRKRLAAGSILAGVGHFALLVAWLTFEIRAKTDGAGP